MVKVIIEKKYKMYTGECPLHDGYPFVPKQIHPPEYVRQHLHLRPTINTTASIFRLRNLATTAFNTQLLQNHYVQVHVPIITKNDCENGGEVKIF